MTDSDAFLQVAFLKRKGRYQIKALPDTARRPTPAQIEIRLEFGESARAARGKRRKPWELPPAAEEVRKRMAGVRSDLAPLTKRNSRKRAREFAEWMVRQGLP